MVKRARWFLARGPFIADIGTMIEWAVAKNSECRERGFAPCSVPAV